MRRYALNPAMPVLLRPDGSVQIGWDPRRAVQVHPPAGLTCAALAGLLRSLQAPATADEFADRAQGLGLSADAVADLLDTLVSTGAVTTAPVRPAARSVSVRIHGRGPLSDLLAGALRCSGTRVSRSNRRHAVVTAEHTDLVVLADTLVSDPRVLRDLHAARVPHLPVRVRDGTGLVGPLVIPGVTSCLSCADLHRSDRDAAWPALAAQLRHAVTTADRATVLGTAALALTQVNLVVRAMRDAPAGTDAGSAPMTLDTTVEFDVGTGSVVTRRWSRHPACAC
ncbi:cyclodehydratase [Mycolicibacterium diernhoferi]|uniref:Cyclodehydratase n=1 Tax=Mycolicibacterium diernhoferi TaxID=1801 RepID=A0A1Q4HAH9_9MYCO|nr:cyclodehydratase [Mycolicibacterium diernhoferi]OJZ64442.1 cyclodehydratase [Mycolicibacterium diernhoferi]OPE54822.1 cyclodehydratase [Mycolicibacterium diernhoferi]PEG52336.1 cyclodehydratase [Mycolicibacterium diernhoferi]QYL24266.1 cyclodehydratase [Mycolicibacterium diernhoferi]